MGLISSSFSFMLGGLCGIYIAQNYNVPSIRRLSNTGLAMAQQIEETYRRPDKTPAAAAATTTNATATTRSSDKSESDRA
ncbi:hypothetical protein HS088_TW17G00460 [Tripterygium wilfordii]|uniref:Uncharacterized protein n=1 Tax=Tripterygium wilfordii TaxID=458696 RepID=A0A7J7CG18_TRIWF|nr:hypothetical protein HS088_TW17G00460 [Tripterygium wilfordii]